MAYERLQRMSARSQTSTVPNATAVQRWTGMPYRGATAPAARPMSHSLARIPAAETAETSVIQRMTEVEKARINSWVQNGAVHYLGDRTADMVTDAAMSQAVRFRWFSLTLEGVSYTAGLNIHYSGALGGLWVINQTTKEAADYHPSADPKHGLPSSLIASIKANHKDKSAEITALLAKI